MQFVMYLLSFGLLNWETGKAQSILYKLSILYARIRFVTPKLYKLVYTELSDTYRLISIAN